MAELRINYEETKSTGKEVVSQAQEFTSLLNTIETVNSNLKTAWEGQDAQKYSAKVEEQAITMKNLATTIEEIGNFLQQVGTAYEQVMMDNSSVIK